jgi:hypothetical protein
MSLLRFVVWLATLGELYCYCRHVVRGLQVGRNVMRLPP